VCVCVCGRWEGERGKKLVDTLRDRERGRKLRQKEKEREEREKVCVCVCVCMCEREFNTIKFCTATIA